MNNFYRYSKRVKALRPLGMMIMNSYEMKTPTAFVDMSTL